MAVTKLDRAPRRTWWQRVLRRLVGARDLVVVVATQRCADGSVHTETFWLDGVDVTQPIAHTGDDASLVAIVPLPEPPEAS